MDGPAPAAFDTTFAHYADAYRQAANCLVDDVVKGRGTLASLAVPTGYCYRHALELALKHAFLWTQGWITAAKDEGFLAHDSTASPKDEEVPVGHDLTELVRRLDGRFEVAGFWRFDPGVRAAINAIGLLDKDSQRFRYPFRAGGRDPSFTKDRFKSLDVERLRSSMDPAVTFLLVEVPTLIRRYLVADREMEELWQAESRMLDLFGDGDRVQEPFTFRDDDEHWDRDARGDRSPEMLSDGDDR